MTTANDNAYSEVPEAAIAAQLVLRVAALFLFLLSVAASWARFVLSMGPAAGCVNARIGPSACSEHNLRTASRTQAQIALQYAGSPLACITHCACAPLVGRQRPCWRYDSKTAQWQSRLMSKALHRAIGRGARGQRGQCGSRDGRGIH